MGIIFHIDANSAYLSWTAVHMLECGHPVDLREVPSVVAGDPKSRHGIILAKSIPAKEYGIKTGESLMEARGKCPELFVAAPDYDLYLDCSDAMFSILSQFSPLVERYSVDECFLDYTASEKRFGNPLKTAHRLREKISGELGFTVNVGISTNKLLAKMAGELKKPDMVHTLWPKEIEKKLWPLPVRELFMVGGATERKLRKLNIRTIGDLAKADPVVLQALLKSHGLKIHDYANGIDSARVLPNDLVLQKGFSNCVTLSWDITDREEAHTALLSLTERLAMRLRTSGKAAYLVSISVCTSTFFHYSRQEKLHNPICTTTVCYQHFKRLFDKTWRGEPVRQLGVRVSELAESDEYQLSFSEAESEKEKCLERTVDGIRKRFGNNAVIRGTFANSSLPPMQGGVNDGNYLMMGGYRHENFGGTG